MISHVSDWEDKIETADTVESRGLYLDEFLIEDRFSFEIWCSVPDQWELALHEPSGKSSGAKEIPTREICQLWGARASTPHSQTPLAGGRTGETRWITATQIRTREEGHYDHRRRGGRRSLTALTEKLLLADREGEAGFAERRGATEFLLRPWKLLGTVRLWEEPTLSGGEAREAIAAAPALEEIIEGAAQAIAQYPICLSTALCK